MITDHRPTGGPVIAIGLVDRVFEQRRCPLMMDLSGAAGNVAIVGAPQSGKTTALRTLVTALACTYDATQVQVYCLDLAGGLGSLAALPHVGSVAGRQDRELVHRTVSHVASVLRERESMFRERGIESMARYRDDPTDGDGYGDVFLVVDGWAMLRQGFEDLEPAIATLAAQGLSYGVHVIMTASRWADIRPALRDQIGSRVELRLGDPADSEIDRARARQVPPNRPGHGLTGDGMPMVIAVPGRDDSPRPAAGDMRAPAVRVLPALVDYGELLGARAPGVDEGLLLGLDEERLDSVTVNFRRNRHLVVLGDGQCGKTATLRLLCHELIRTIPGAAAQIFVVDPRRALAGVLDIDRLAGYVASPTALTARLGELTAMLEQRVPAEDDESAPPETVWPGRDVYLVIDDHDLLAGAGAAAMAKVAELIPYSRDIGLHVVLARRGGGSRALYDPTVVALRDAGAVMLQMSAGGDEPLVAAGRSRRLPPGRAVLVDHTGLDRRIQVAWIPPADGRR